jgi:hypothetical protein
MTFHISKLFQIAVSTLAIVPLTLNFSPVRAESSNATGDTHSLTVKVARNQLQPFPVEESTDDNNAETETGSIRDRSMKYIKIGYEAEQAGDEELALLNYYTSATIDPTNGYAYLMAGRLIGNNESGIQLVNISMELFKAEQDMQGYQLARKLLASSNASN